METAVLCQVSVKRILYSQAIHLQQQEKQKKEKEERRLKAEKKKKAQEELTSAAGIEIKPKVNRSSKKNMEETEVSTEDEINFAEMPSFHLLADLDEDETFTPKRQRFETNEHFRIFDGVYQIVDEHYKILSPMPLDARFKGTIPSENVEYLYLFKATRCTDTRGEFFRIDKILAMSRNDLSMDTILTIFKRDLKLPAPRMMRFLDDHNMSVGAQEHIEYKRFCSSLNPEWLQSLQNVSPFFANYDKFPLSTLIHCFPNDFIYLLDLEKSNPIEFNMLWQEFINNLSSFFFQPICREFSLTSPLNMLSYITWFLQNNQISKTPMDMSKFLPPQHGSKIISAVDMYKRIKACLKEDGSTAFLVSHLVTRVLSIPEGENVPNLEENESFKLLVETGVLLKQELGGVNFYAPRSDAKATKIILDSLEDLCKRFTPLPMNTDTLEPHYNEGQLKIFAVSQRQPIVLVTAGPGFGKTTTIEGLMQLYGPSKCILATQVASMVTGHRKRGMESETLAMIIHRRFPKKKFSNIFSKTTHELNMQAKLIEEGVIRVETAEERLQKVLDEYEKIEVLIIDEASNMDNKTASMLFACLPNIKLLFLVFDNGQIAPIGPGQLAFDILKFFEKNRLFIGELKENMRVNRDPQAQQILVNDQLLMAGKVKEMVFNPLPGKGNSLGPGVYQVDYHNQHTLQSQIELLFSHYLPDIDRSKVITLTNRERTLVNETVDNWMKQKLKNEIPLTAKFYRGQRLTIMHQNYRKKKVSDRPLASSDAINNGEEFTFGKCRSLTLSPSRTWNGEGQSYAEERHLIPENDKKRIFLIDDQEEKRYCIGDGFINKDNVQPAWAITSNKSQGQEYECVVVVLPPTIQAVPKCFIRNHLHVMISRPKSILVLVGSRTVLEALGQRKANERFTLLTDLCTMRLRSYFQYSKKELELILMQDVATYKPIQMEKKKKKEAAKRALDDVTAPKKRRRRKEESSSSDEDIGQMSSAKIAMKLMKQLSGSSKSKRKQEESSDPDSDSSDSESSSDSNSSSSSEQRKQKKKDKKKSDSSESEDSDDDSVVASEAEEKGSDESDSDPEPSEEGSLDESDPGDLEAADEEDARVIRSLDSNDEPSSGDRDFLASDNESIEEDENLHLDPILETHKMKKPKKRKIIRKSVSSSSSNSIDDMILVSDDEQQEAPPPPPKPDPMNIEFNSDDFSEESHSSSLKRKRSEEEEEEEEESDEPPPKKPRISLSSSSDDD